MISCNKKKSGISTVTVDAQQMPMVHTENLSSLVSDSGVTRFRMSAQIVDMYQTDTGSYWHFPQGIYIEQFDTLFNVEGSLQADTAYNYESHSLWRVIGNVYIRNLEGLIFETSELYWDGNPVSPAYAIYTDKFVKVTTPEGRILTGKGMHSDLQMNNYVFYQSGGEFQGYERSSNTEGSDSIGIDSISRGVVPLRDETEDSEKENATEIVEDE